MMSAVSFESRSVAVLVKKPFILLALVFGLLLLLLAIIFGSFLFVVRF